MQLFLTRIVQISFSQRKNYLRCITYTPGVTKQKPSKRANCGLVVLCTHLYRGFWLLSSVGSYFPLLITMSPGHMDIVWGVGANSILMPSANVGLWKYVCFGTLYGGYIILWGAIWQRLVLWCIIKQLNSKKIIKIWISLKTNEVFNKKHVLFSYTTIITYLIPFYYI